MTSDGGAAISPASALLFVVLLAAAMAASLVISPGPTGLLGALLAAQMLAIAVSDARHRLIPNTLTASAFAMALAYHGLFAPDASAQAAGLALLRAVTAATPFLALLLGYRWLRGRDGLGLGDVKLAAVAGAWLDWVTILGVVDVAAVAALAGAFALSATGRRMTTVTAIPFGLFLAPAIWLGWLFEQATW